VKLLFSKGTITNCVIGKGWLDNLFYIYNRSHLRNDAFILRGDGGGF
jgi:hypothetical protein